MGLVDLQLGTSCVTSEHSGSLVRQVAAIVFWQLWLLAFVLRYVGPVMTQRQVIGGMCLQPTSQRFSMQFCRL
jgi:hypothetical protein